MNTLPVYVINLARQPERLEKFKQINDFIAEKINVFPAVDGKLVPRRSIVLKGIIGENNIYTPHAIGVLLSHLNLWKIAVNSDHGITIMEDDAIIHKSFFEKSQALIESKLDDFDMIAWGYNFDWPCMLAPPNGLTTPQMIFPGIGDPGNCEGFIDRELYRNTQLDTKLLQAKMFAGTCAYTISPKGAQKLIDELLPLDMYFYDFIGNNNLYSWRDTGVDIGMNKLRHSIKSYICFPMLVYSPNEARS